ncbi:LamG domain-containing protein [Kribbella lupini]|uniref:LamG-like jellyroll fold domain-containing protein n=1 Tax=Kribbella lupini TaxID=291602 RepID=A0ABN2AC93_9ACTN
MQGWSLFRRGAVTAVVALGVGGLGGLTAAADDPPVPPTPPAISVSYQGVPIADCLEQTVCPQVMPLGESVAVTVAATSGDVVSVRYGFSGQLPVDVDGSTVSVTMAPPHEGWATLEARSINAIGQFSSPAYFMFNVGPRPAAVGSWGFDEGTGTTAADGPGLTHPLTLGGGAALDAKGRIDGSLALDGVDGTARATAPVIDTSKSFSMSAWVRPTNAATTGVVAAVTGTRTTAAGLGYDAGTKRWTFARTSADVNLPAVSKVSSKEAPVNGAWAHLLGTYDAATGQLQLFVNGRLQQTAQSAVGWQAAGPLTVGRGKSAGTPTGAFAGSVDRLAVWQRVLVADEIPPLVDPRVGGGGNDRITAGLAAYWPLDDAVRTNGTSRTPEQVRGADLTLTGFAKPAGAFVDDPELGRVLELTGRSQESLSLNASTVDGSASFTVAARVKIDDPSKPMVVARQGTAGKDTWRLEYRPVDTFTSQWRFIRGDAGSATETVAVASIDHDSLPGWHLLAGSYNANLANGTPRLELTVDNRPSDGSIVPYQATPPRAGTTVVGTGRTSGQAFDGRIDDLRVYAGLAASFRLCADYPGTEGCGA